MWELSEGNHPQSQEESWQETAATCKSLAGDAPTAGSYVFGGILLGCPSQPYLKYLVS